MSSRVWILTTDARMSGLLGTVSGLDASIEAVVVGSREVAENVAVVDGPVRVLLMETSDAAPVQAATRTLVELAARESPDLVVAGSSREDKVLLATCAAGMGTDVLTGVSGVRATGLGIEIDRTLYGATVAETSVWSCPVTISAESGAIPEPAGRPSEIVDVAVEPMDVEVVARDTTDSQRADLSTARRIVAVGRGMRSEDDLALIDRLAGALGAEVACSRPLAEGLDWFSKDRYIGVSGQHVAPELYVAVGISGQLQHMVGVQRAGTIIAINSDKDAPIFEQCDYGVVGDLYQVLPALTGRVTSHD